MPGKPDSTSTVTQAQFDRLTGASRDAWRKWSRRKLTDKRRGGYAWLQVVEGLALQAMEDAAGLETVVQCWEDIRQELRSHIRQPILDLVIDPGTSEASRPRLRAFVSTSDETTAALARAAREPHVLPLADDIAAAREEFERIIARAKAHADPGPGRQSDDQGGRKDNTISQ